MPTIDGLLARVRSGEIVHMRAPAMFSPVFDALKRALESKLRAGGDLAWAFERLTWPDLEPALNHGIRDLDCTREHFRRMASVLMDAGSIAGAEGMLDITLDKSLRLCVGGHKKNYGYFVHRDSWFDLAPDGVNVVLYLTDVPAHGNTQFYTDHFQTLTPYDPETRRLLDESGLTRVTAYNCRAGDVMIFSGNHLHGGALCETNRLSVEFRLSRLWDFGRPDRGIVYRGLSDFVRNDAIEVAIAKCGSTASFPTTQ